MKKITKEDIETVELELAVARKRFERMNFKSLDEQLSLIQEFFNEYVPRLEKRFMTEKEIEDWIFLPNELRIKFYQYFPEHGLNMANYSQELVKANSKIKKLTLVNRFNFNHND